MAHQLKSAGQAAQVDGGSVKGYASTFDREPDSYGDVIAPGAFAKSLESWRERNGQGVYIPLLYGHSTDDPAYNIGRVVDAAEDERGLLVTAEFDPENEKAQYVRKLVQEGRLYQFSFAFNCTDWAEVDLEGGRKANELREIELFEVSLVQIPANQHAEVVEVKAAKAGRRNSKADEQALAEVAEKLRGIAEECAEAQSIVNGLTGDQPEEQPDEEPEANAEEPKANAEEQGRIAELLAKADRIIGKE